MKNNVKQGEMQKEDLILLREFVALHFKFYLNIYEL